MPRETNPIVNKFSDGGERRTARVLYEKYMDDYSIETISDLNTLGEIIYLEVIQVRLQTKLNQMYSSEAKAVPTALVETIHKNSDAILRLKSSLGLNKTKETKTFIDRYNQLMKRAKQWENDNQASRTIKCPNCLNFILLKIRTDIWEAQNHPFFKDNILYNKVLFEKYYNKTVVVDDAFIAEVLETSPDYITWVKEKSSIRYEGNDKTQEEQPQEESKKELQEVSGESSQENKE